LEIEYFFDTTVFCCELSIGLIIGSVNTINKNLDDMLTDIHAVIE
jgi:hypothetical protein